MPPRWSPLTTIPSSSAGLPSRLRRLPHLARVQVASDLGGRDAFEQRHRPHREAESLQQLEVAAPPAAEAEVLARDHDLSPGEMLGRELLGLLLGDVEREVEHRRLGDSELGQQLEPPLEARDQLHEVSEHDPRMRIEGQHPNGEPGRPRLFDHPAMPEMDSVERPDRNGHRHGSSASA